MTLRKTTIALIGTIVALGMTMTPMDADAKRRKKKTRTLSFEDDQVEASFLRPEGSTTTSLSKKKRSSLIRVRMDFFAEIIRSARDL
ncbi:MAG: hypothetical protein KC502_14290 [Myxococcales bacterium]|nr:hypothetical protein [Myxococcales bacterium]